LIDWFVILGLFDFSLWMDCAGGLNLWDLFSILQALSQGILVAYPGFGGV